MDERKNGVWEMTNEEYRISSPDYGELIVEMVHRIDDEKFLCFIYELLNSFKKKWGI